MTNVNAIKHQLPNLETKKVWSLFTWNYRDYTKSPFTAKGERHWKIFQLAKQELIKRKEGWWES
jgi:hypothetical protein